MWHCGIRVSFVPREGSVLALVQPSPCQACPVFRRVSSLIIYLSLKCGRCGPSLQLWKLWKGSGYPEASHPTLLAPLLLRFLWAVLKSCAAAAACGAFKIWVLSCLFWKSYTDSFYLKWLSLSPLSDVLMETEHAFLLRTVWLQYDSGLPTVFWDAKSGTTFPIYSICVCCVVGFFWFCVGFGVV